MARVNVVWLGLRFKSNQFIKGWMGLGLVLALELGSEMCGSRNVASASVRGSRPQIRVRDRVRRQIPSRIRCQSASPRLAFSF